ncbi:NUDIX domain-containing protein [Candidatus Falkowbacteria bacterium]|nr:NUDIX domain-containing protein [Candidatus Falkowbacteria bacterium]
MSHKERFRAYVAAYLVLVKDGQVLLLRRYNTGYQDGNYSLVAGHLDGGETASQCIIREAAEEAGIVLESVDLEVSHVMHRISSDREYFDIYLTASKWSGEVKNMEPEKCDELAWYPLDNLPKNVLPEVKQALDDIRMGVHYSEIGL